MNEWMNIWLEDSSIQEEYMYTHLNHNVFQQLPTEQLLCARDTYMLGFQKRVKLQAQLSEKFTV